MDQRSRRILPPADDVQPSHKSRHAVASYGALYPFSRVLVSSRSLTSQSQFPLSYQRHQVLINTHTHTLSLSSLRPPSSAPRACGHLKHFPRHFPPLFSLSRALASPRDLERVVVSGSGATNSLPCRPRKGDALQNQTHPLSVYAS